MFIHFSLLQIPWVGQSLFERAFLWSAEVVTIQKCSFGYWKWTECWSKFNKTPGSMCSFENETLEQATILFQATINLMIGYDPPAGSVPDPNDPQAGDATVDAGNFLFLIANKAGWRSKGCSCWFIDLLMALFVCWLGGGEEGNETSPDGCQNGVSGAPSSPGQPPLLRQRAARSQSRHRLVNKPQDFQVRLHDFHWRDDKTNSCTAFLLHQTSSASNELVAVFSIFSAWVTMFLMKQSWWQKIQFTGRFQNILFTENCSSCVTK